jgi:hypothetical protein
LLQLLALEQPHREEETEEENSDPLFDSNVLHHSQRETTTVTLSAIYQGRRRTLIELLPSPNYPDSPEMSKFSSNTNPNYDPGPMWGMNSIFGDPIPGTSKRLTIQYRITASDDNDQGPRRKGILQTDSFAEHERVCLRCRHWNWGDDDLPSNQNYDHQTGNATAVVLPKAETHSAELLPVSSTTSSSKSMYQDAGTVVLPWIMAYLEVHERVRCQLVCKSWCHGIREWGVATILDDSGGRLAVPTRHEEAGPADQPSYSREYLRGVLQNSYASLHSLYLRSTPDITKEDIHPALHGLEKLTCLDISRCRNLDDTTLELLAASPARDTLRVLYLKGLDRVTDRGIITMAQSCIQLTTLDLSQISAITDRAGKEIGTHLKHLKALFLRDNYKLTNNSIDVITSGISTLQQLTLWGSIHIRHLNGFGTGNDCHRLNIQPCNIVMLNLRGCHNLGDDAAQALKCMQRHLRSLDVSECHRLTDHFAVSQFFPLVDYSTMHSLKSNAVFRGHVATERHCSVRSTTESLALTILSKNHGHGIACHS